MTGPRRYVPTDETQRELLYWYTELGSVVHQLGVAAAEGRVEQSRVDRLRAVLATFEAIADELEER